MGKFFAAVASIFMLMLLFGVFGWGLILWPLGILGGAWAIWGLISYTSSRRQAKAEAARLQPLRTKEEIGRLEAEQGIPVATEGSCTQCGKPLAVHAKFCAYCRAPTVRYAMICPQCRTRNFEDARYCAECGADLSPATDEASEGSSDPAQSPDLAPTNQPDESWICPYCTGHNPDHSYSVCRHCARRDQNWVVIHPSKRRDEEEVLRSKSLAKTSRS